MRLTKRYIDQARYDGGGNRDVRWDEDLPGFGMRVYPSGKKSFVLSYRVRRRKRFLTLGAYGPLTLSMARDLARKRLAEIINGGDPLAERRRDNDGETFGALAELFLERHARPNKKPRSVAEDERLIKRELDPHWKNRLAAEIRRRDVIALLDKIVDRPAPITANRTRALISKIFNFAISRDLVEINPAAQVSPPGREVSRQRVFSDDELRALWGAFEKLSPVMGSTFKMRLLTLQRGSEVSEMKWSDLDLVNGWWTIPPEVAKNGLAHRVDISSTALEIIDAMRIHGDGADWVFPSPRIPSQPIRHFGKAVETVKKLTGISDFRPHDLRRTGATRLTGMGIPRLTVSKILNHAETGVTAIYDRHSYDAEKARALAAWDQHVRSLLTGDGAASNVIAMERQRA